MRKNKCLSTVCEYKSHVAEESSLRAMVGGGRGSPRAQHGLNDESPRITVVSLVPEHEGDRDSPKNESGWNNP